MNPGSVQDEMSGRIVYPALYEINTRVLLRKLEQASPGLKTLDDIPDSLLDEWASVGFDWIWLLGVWQTGPAGQKISRLAPALREEFHQSLPDCCDADVSGSCFAVTGYSVSEKLGGNAALLRIRDRLSRRNLRLMLDFVPNHTALDHPWVRTHPEYYI